MYQEDFSPADMKLAAQSDISTRDESIGVEDSQDEARRSTPSLTDHYPAARRFERSDSQGSSHSGRMDASEAASSSSRRAQQRGSLLGSAANELLGGFRKARESITQGMFSMGLLSAPPAADLDQDSTNTDSSLEEAAFLSEGVESPMVEELEHARRRVLEAEAATGTTFEAAFPSLQSLQVLDDRSHLQMQARSGNADSGAGEPAASAAKEPGVDLDTYLEEVHEPFRRLLLPCVDGVDGARIGVSSGSAPPEGELDRETQTPLLLAIERTKFIGRIIGCCELVCSDLSAEESSLWDTFVSTDETLRATVAKDSVALRQVLHRLAPSDAMMEAWMAALAQRSDESGELDFADLLDWLADEREQSQIWSLHNTVRASVSQLLGGVPSSLPQSCVTDLRGRCSRESLSRLKEAFTAYQRSMILTFCWRCERRLVRVLGGASVAGKRGQELGSRWPLAALLAVLNHIHQGLRACERALWEVLGAQDTDFAGLYTREEVTAAIGSFADDGPSESSEANREAQIELQMLRSQCQERSLDDLFSSANRDLVTFADVLRWWWDLEEDYKIAAGLAVPAALERQSHDRRPEEMFRAGLRRAAADPSVAQKALRGHVRAVAELAALELQRTMDAFCLSPCPTRTTTSEAPMSEFGEALPMDEEEEEEDNGTTACQDET